MTPDDPDPDDYMTMVIEDAPPAGRPVETSLQRRERQRREGERRGRVKSKAELAAEEEAAREKALRTSMLADPEVAKKSKGFAMMAKMGFTGGALGREQESGSGRQDGGQQDAEDAPRTEPIRISIKDDRSGIGMESERKRKLREAADAAEGQAKRAKAEEGEYRERVRREREVARLERQVYAAQKVAEGMEEEEQNGSKGLPSRPLKSVNVLWRGLVRAREVAARDRSMRRDLEQSLSRLPAYEDADEDADDKKALGKTETAYEAADDLDEEDGELDEFEALEPEDKLRRLVEHLREQHRYCFWCKAAYPDDAMEGCPGATEEEHD